MKSFQELRKLNLKETQERVRDSVTEDLILIQATNTLDKLIKSINILTEGLREYYSYYLPEISKRIQDNEEFITIISKNSKQEIIKKFNIRNSMGKDFKEEDLKQLTFLIKQIKDLFEIKKQLTTYIENLAKKIAPETSKIAQPLITARLMSLAGSFKNLAFSSSSKIQLLGAEKALFRHLKNKNFKSPKFGVIFQNQEIQKAKNKGKEARHLAAKISIAVKKDYFSRK